MTTKIVLPKIYLCLSLLFISNICKAQKIGEKVIQNPDGTQTIEERGMNRQIIRKETYKGEEPVGKWMVLKGLEKNPRTLDYDFTVVYGDPKEKRSDSASFIKIKNNVNPLEDKDSLGYKGPRFTSGETSLVTFVQRNIAYPQKAIQQELQGNVWVRFVISESGTVEDIKVIKGVNILLDKEAVRIVNLFKFSGPASLNGVDKKLLLVLPISFRIGD